MKTEQKYLKKNNHWYFGEKNGMKNKETKLTFPKVKIYCYKKHDTEYYIER